MLLAKDMESDARVCQEAKSLFTHGYDVTVVAWDREGCHAKKGTYEGIKVERISLTVPFTNPRLSLLPYLLVFNAMAFLRIVSMNFDLVHCHDLDTLLGGLLAGKLRHKKVVYDAHEIYPLMVEQHLPNLLVGILSALEFSLIKKVDFLVAVNQIAYDYFRVGVHQGNLSIVMNFKDLDAFKISEREIVELRKSLGIENRFIILYDGWLVPNNGLEELFSAFGKLDGRVGDMVAVICGDGFAEEEYKREVKEKHIETYVKFVGKIESRKIPVYVSACDIMYVVRRPEKEYNVLSTPNRLFEAIIAGKPVIASNFGNIRRIVEEGGFGLLVNPRNINELCSALLTLRNDKKAREKLGERAKSMSRTFNWISMEKRLLSLYEDLTVD
jgi:1,2-diacylglycerol 3-alpha-glucosyltransferase